MKSTYYLGSGEVAKYVVSGAALRSIRVFDSSAGAIESAQLRLQAAGPEVSEISVVKVIAVVRRATLPVEVIWTE